MDNSAINCGEVIDAETKSKMMKQKQFQQI